jgi:hypothetical protein
MDENPYKAPAEDEPPEAEENDERWHPLTWGLVGFAIGTLTLSPLVLSIHPIDRLRGGAIFGGIPAALCSYSLAAYRRGKKRRFTSDSAALKPDAPNSL